MKKSKKGGIKAVFHEEAKEIFDGIRKITAQQNELHNKQLRENLLDKFTKIKKDKS